MILLFIQSNSTACSNSMNCNCPSIWITFKFKIACCAALFRKFWPKCMKGILCCAIVSAPNQEIFFFFFWTKFRELFLKVKLSREVHEWCTSRVQLSREVHIQGPMNQFQFCINTHSIWQRNHTCPEVIGRASTRKKK